MNNNFKNFNLSDNILRAIKLLGYTSPTPVQEQLIPLLLNNREAIVKSQTGSGKTASFVVPICQHINWDENKAQALILAPTRELAMQINEDIFNIGRFKRIKSSALFGADSFNRQSIEIKQKNHIVVGTPGRVLDHLSRNTFDVSNIKYLVIDEADEMLSLGFIEDVHKIISYLPNNIVTTLLSATLDAEVLALSNRYLKNPTVIEIKESSTVLDRVSQSFYSATEENKQSLLSDITTIENPDSCIIFCNTQVTVDFLYKYLSKKSYPVAKIHGGMEQKDRTEIMKQFRQGRFRYLIATDVAARGIDIDNISLVVNYDTPKKPAIYIHRIGRTGRIGNSGKAITFVTDVGVNSFEEIKSFTKIDFTFENPPSKSFVTKSEESFKAKISKGPVLKASRTASLSSDITKLHINAGKKTKMRAVDIVGTLCSLDGMTADDIGIITILEVSTFVEILNGKGDFVYKSLQNKPIKGRLRTVSLAGDR